MGLYGEVVEIEVLVRCGVDMDGNAGSWRCVEVVVGCGRDGVGSGWLWECED